MTTPQFRPDRLTTLRHLERLSQKQLAQDIGLDQAQISRIERGLLSPSENVLTALRLRYSLPSTFFHIDAPVSGVPTFRKTSAATKTDENRVVALNDEAARFWEVLSDQSGYRPAALMQTTDPEQAAIAFRESAGLTEGAPVLNVTRLIERAGFGVITQLSPDSSTPEDNHKVKHAHSGISRPTLETDRPLVAIVHHLPGAVQRLTLLHEVAHWIFDRERLVPIRSTRDPAETRAFQFAAAVLLPAEVARERIDESLSLHGYLKIKADFGLSVGALLARGRDLGQLSPERYRSLSIQLSSRGWRTQEPVTVPRESPALIQQAFPRVWKDVKQAADALGIMPSLLDLWVGPADHSRQPPAVSTSTQEEAPPMPDNVISLDRRRTSAP